MRFPARHVLVVLVVLAACTKADQKTVAGRDLAKVADAAHSKTGPIDAATTTATAAAPTAARARTPARAHSPTWQWSDWPDLYPLADITFIHKGARYALGQRPIPSPSRRGTRSGAATELSRTNADGTRAWTTKLRLTIAPLDGAVAVPDDTRLYVAHYNRISSGCELSAYSIADGKRLWSVRLQGLGPIYHSQYSNRIQLRFIDGDIGVFGHEAQGRYIEVRDSATGNLEHHQKLPPTPYIRPMTERIYLELASKLVTRKAYKVRVKTLLKRLGLAHDADKAKDLIRRLHNVDLGGGKYVLRVGFKKAADALVLHATRVKTAGKCHIAVTALTDATIYRGPIPIAPYQRNYYRTNHSAARRRNSMGHGDHHLRCTYAVTVNGKRFTYPHNISNTGRRHDESHCKTMQSTIAGEILSFGKGCTDFAHGEYYGYRLTPAP